MSNGIKQGYRGYAVVSPTAGGPIRILCRPGSRLSQPRPLEVPYPISNQAHGELNYAEGLQFPVLELNTVPMAAWFTAANFNAWFITRSSDDISAIGSGGIDFADSNEAAGTGAFRVNSPKGANLRISFSKGEPIQCSMTFMGQSLDSSNGAADVAAGLTGSPLMFNSVSFGGAFASTFMVGASFTISTGATANPELNGSLNPIEINAGLITASLTLTHNGFAALADDSAGTITINGVNFAFTDIVCINPKDRAQQAGRVLRTYDYRCFGSTTLDPVVIT